MPRCVRWSRKWKTERSMLIWVEASSSRELRERDKASAAATASSYSTKSASWRSLSTGSQSRRRTTSAPLKREKFKDMSRIYLGLSEKWLNKLVADKEFMEVQWYEKEK